ncbi:hypothetical protein OAK47_03435, partial [Planctomycetaceae bacterium]|nr:hypothetical protein [Planctomycetaceae bacterium]
FLLLHFACTAESYNVQFEQIMGRYWVDGYLPLDRPWMIPFWFLKVCTSHCFEYPLGGDHGAATLPFVGLVVGSVLFFKRRNANIVMLGAGVLFFALIASAIQRYPFGGHARLMQYLAPLACLFISLGFVAILEIFRPAQIQRRSVFISLGILAILPVVVMVQDINKPYKRIHYQQHREFAHKLWQQSSTDKPLYCLMRSPAYAPEWEHFPYRCSQSLETKGDFLTLPERDQLDTTKTYRAVVWYRLREAKKNFPLWEAELQKQFVIREREVFTIEAKDYTETFEVLSLQPRVSYQSPEMTASKLEQKKTTQ